MQVIRCLILLLTSTVLAPSAVAQPKTPVSIIFDTDIGPDYDDVGAITLLYALADSGQARILATNASNRFIDTVNWSDILAINAFTQPISWKLSPNHCHEPKTISENNGCCRTERLGAGEPGR